MKVDKPTAAAAAELQDEDLQATRRVTEEALDRYTDLYDFAPVAYFTLHGNGEIARANLAGARLLGRERDRLIGMRLVSFLTDLTLSAFDALLLNVFADGTPQRCEAALMQEDQPMRVVQIEATPSTKRHECNLVVLDITERKQTEEALRKSEARLRGIIRTGPECVKVVSREGWLLEMNLAGLAMLEAGSLEDVQKQPLLQFIAPEYRVAFGELHQRVMRGANGALEFEVIGLKGTRRWLETHATPLRDSSGQVEALLGITGDITARKQADKELQRSNQLLQAAQDTAHVGGWEWDIASNTIYWTDETYRLFETSPAQYTPTVADIGRFFGAADASAIRDFIRTAVICCQPHDIEVELITFKGRRFWVRTMCTPIIVNGRTVKLSGAFQDNTRPRQHEEQLKATLSSLHATLESTTDGILVVGLSGKIIQFNRRFVEMWSIPQAVLDTRSDEKALGFVLEQLADPVAFVAKVEELMHDALAESLDRLNFKDGRIYERYSRPLVMEGSSAGRVWSFRDVTARMVSERLQSALFKISVASHESSDLNDLYRRVHGIISELMTAHNCYIAILDEANDQIRFDYWVDEMEASSAPLRFSDGIGLTDRVLRTGQPLLVYPHSAHEGALPEGVTIIGPQGIDWLGVPLKVLDKTIGVLAVQNYSGGSHYQQSHLDLLQFVSDQVAAAVNRKRIEQQQLDSDQRFRDLVDSTDGIVWQADASTFVFDYVSNNAERLLGYPLTDWLQPGFWVDHIHPEDRDRTVQYCVACTGRFEDHEFEYRFLTRSGSEVWLRDIVKVVVEDGKPRWLRGLMLDITSMKRTQQSLEQANTSLARTQHLLEASQYAAQVGGWELDVASGNLFWTNETYRIHDLTPDDYTPVVETALNFYTPESRQVVAAAVQLSIDEGTPYDLELELISAQGRHLWARSTGSATRVAGRTIKIGGAFQDITERKRAEQWQQQYSRVLAMISAEASLPFVLEELARFVENQSRGSSCSILLLSNDGLRLTHGAAPSLPDYFVQALDGMPIGEQGGACGTAALEGAPVLVEDFHAADQSIYRLELANRAGLRSCWSRPIFSSEHKVMGTFALYHGEPWSPTPVDEELLRRAASLASLAIDRSRHQEAQQLAKTVFQENIEGVMVTSSDDRILMVNPAFERLTGYSVAEAVGQAPTLLDSGRHDETFWAAIRSQLTHAGRWEGEVWSRRKNGEIYLTQMSVADVRSDAGATSQRISIIKDMSLQMVQAARIEQLAFYDALTGLPNRALFLDRLENILASAQRQGSRGAILFMDLDHFKEINDSKGHAVGDLALAEVARRFLTACRREETLARLGGDEFVLIAEGADHQAAALVASRLLRSLSEPLILMGVAHSIGASIGIAIYPDDGATTEELIKHADIAMFRAKAASGGYRFYQADMSAEFEKHLGIAQRLSAAMEADQLQLYYQPKIALATGKLTGAEALLRWHDADLGWISPADFVPIAEQRGLMGKLGDWVLRRACLQLVEWRNRGIGLPGRLSVNVSARQLEDPEIVGRMLEIVHVAGATPGWLALELTESSMMIDPEQSIEIMEYFAAAGFGLSIDDFGTGYSSLAYLKRFAADELKIDISFVRNMLTDADDYAIVGTIITMAQGFGMTTAAEGVELEGQAEALKALRCNVAQGYLYSPPEAPDVFAGKWLGAEQAGPD